jgi:hypothetical protein
MERSTGHQEFERLLSQLFEGSLDASEIRALSAIVESNRELRRRYLEHCQMHAMLRSEHGLLTAGTEVKSIEGAKFSRQSRWQNVLTLAIAASIIAAVSTIWWRVDRRDVLPHRGREVALVGKTVGGTFAYGPNGEASPAEGTKMRQGFYELRNGLVEIEYPSGAVLVVQAPAMFELVDDECIRLEDGRLAAHVPEAAIGFRIDSPGATVIDLGTDFAVHAVRDQESEVHVFQGEVLVDLRGEKGRASDPLRLVTGEATRVDYFTGMPSGIDLDTQQFVRSLREPESAYADVVVALDPVVYYRMEPSGDGTRLLDSSPNRADAIIHLGRATSPVWTVGKVGAALQLGGTAQQTFAFAPSYPQTDGDTLTVAAWVYARSRPRWASIAKNWAGGDYDRGQFHFGLNFDGGELEAHIVDSSGEEIAVLDSVPLPLHRWHHVAFVADGRMLRLYRNGQEIDAKPYNRLHRDPRITALAVGTKLNLAGDAPEEKDYNMWDGRLDEVAIFNDALTPDQIQSLWRAQAND